MGATVIRTSGSEGASCGSASMCEWIFAGVPPPGILKRRRGRGGSPPGAISAEGGLAVHRGADHVELPLLARPKGCFDTSAEWS